MRNKKPICQTYPNGTKYWWLNGKLHRESGPAIVYKDDIAKYFLNGEQYTEPDFYRELHKRGKISREELFIHLL